MECRFECVILLIWGLDNIGRVESDGVGLCFVSESVGGVVVSIIVGCGVCCFERK